MNLLPDLFSFAYVPGWYRQLDELAELARPEPWRFREPMYFYQKPRYSDIRAVYPRHFQKASD